MRVRKLSMALLVCGMSIAWFATPPGVADGPTPEVPSAAQTSTLTSAQIQLLNSGGPIDVVMDPTTGNILSVTSNSVGFSPDISNHSVCDTGNGCYKTNRVPYADQGFYGSAGTYDGSWPYRSGYSSGNYTVYACWSSACGPDISPGSQISFTSDVTGTSFTIL